MQATAPKKMKFMNKFLMNNILGKFAAVGMLMISANVYADKFEPIKYGNFDSWVTRNIKESAIIGGADKKVYAIGPTATLGDSPYVPQGGSPWASSNVLAKVCGIIKTSNAIYPTDRPGHGKCAKLATEFEHVKALGIVNLDVAVAGTMFLGRMYEPITSTKNPYTKLDVGIPFTRRPKALRFDYKVSLPGVNTRIHSSGLGPKKTLQGADHPVCFMLLQRRWEDEKGNLYAKRVGTAYEKFTKSCDWKNAHDVKVYYGESNTGYGLIPKAKSYNAKNSKGKLVPVQEVGWDAPDATPTHLVLFFSSGGGEPYEGTIGTDFYVDNVGLVY